MKKILPFYCLLLGTLAVDAQLLTAPDTILYQSFNVDPTDTMGLVPTGNDLIWVNWDADGETPICDELIIVPGNWYWEGDINDPNNSVFASCSWFEDPKIANENWLITPPVLIPDSATVLFWRSLSFEGPGFLDGYKVLVSTGGNEPFTGAFTDTLFVAAEMDKALVGGSLDPDDYTFSPGYIHAKRYTDTAYFFLAKPDNYSYQGRLEPHSVSLKKYAGQRIYIAFLHDTKVGNFLQLDDIAIVHGVTDAVQTPIVNYFLEIQPNPAHETARLSWQVNTREPGLLTLHNLVGKRILEQRISNLSLGSARLDIRHIPAGLYACTLQTANGQQTVLLVKQ